MPGAVNFEVKLQREIFGCRFASSLRNAATASAILGISLGGGFDLKPVRNPPTSIGPRVG